MTLVETAASASHLNRDLDPFVGMQGAYAHAAGSDDLTTRFLLRMAVSYAEWLGSDIAEAIWGHTKFRLADLHADRRALDRLVYYGLGPELREARRASEDIEDEVTR